VPFAGTPDERTSSVDELNKKIVKAYSEEGLLRGGTGSYPEVPQGLQRAKRLIPIHKPRSAPHSFTASIVY